MSENIVYVDKETMEIKAERTEFSKTFYVTDTERRLEASRSPIHVQNKKGEWDDITCEIKNNKVTKCPYKAKLLKDKIGYQLEQEDSFIEIELSDAKYTTPVIEGNTATWKNLTAGVDVTIAFTPQGASLVRVLKNKSAKKSAEYRILLPEDRAEHISFNGKDAEGKNTHLEQKEKSSKNKKRKGTKLVEKVIIDKFCGEVAEIDEVTRKRSYSKDVAYPVVVF
jgi:hypothetical protein